MELRLEGLEITLFGGLQSLRIGELARVTICRVIRKAA